MVIIPGVISLDFNHILSIVLTFVPAVHIKLFAAYDWNLLILGLELVVGQQL